MTEAERPPSAGVFRRRRTRHRQRGALVAYWLEWRVEITIVLLLACGVFLILERWQIRQTLLRWLQVSVQTMADMGLGFLQGTATLLRRTTLSDLIGLSLLLIALAVVLQRTRWRLMTHPRFTRRMCPRCGSELHRIHRRRADRVANLLVPVRRFQCRNPDCRWRGLRVGRSGQE